MSDSSQSADTPAAASDSAQAARLGVTVYQIAASDHFRSNRTDGTGWAWSWADSKRQWMSKTPAQFAYRCLPISMANQTGWWVYNPVGFSAWWDGNPAPSGVHFQFDAAAELWGSWVISHFGHGIITWRTPFLFVTSPAQSRLLVTGPMNYFKHGVQPLSAIIESDWMKMSFTMNWKFTAPNSVIRFEVGEPILQVIPLVRNVGADLESADVQYMLLQDDPALAKQYQQWTESRLQFHQGQSSGAVPPNSWQKDYFKGKDATRPASPPEGHRTKLTPPKVRFKNEANRQGAKTPRNTKS